MNTCIVPTLAVRMVLGAIVLGGPLTGLAQDAEPTAAEALDAAVLRYEEGDYVGARHALSQVDVQALDHDGRDRHAQFLQVAEMAVRQQLQADLDQAAGLQALSDGRLDDAEALFQGVFTNEFASSATRGVAEAELEKLAVQRAMESERPVPPSSTRPAAEEPTEQLADELRSLRAKVLTREASEAMAAGRLGEAERLFKKALSQVPGYPEAAAGLERLAGHELVESDARSLIDRIQERNAIAWQRTLAMYRVAEREVRDQVRAQRFDEAHQVVLRARQVIEAGKRFASPVSRYEALVHDVEDLLGYVEAQERTYHDEAVRRQRDSAIRENETRLRTVRENREKRIRAWMDEAMQLRRDRRYGAAIDVLKRVTTFDPTNEQARWLIEDLGDQLAYREQRDIRNEINKGALKVLIDTERSKIPWWQEDPAYPKNWREIISRPTRIAPGAEPSANIDPDLQSRLDAPIGIDFRNEPFEQAIEKLAEAGDVDISVAWSDLEAASVDRRTPVTLRLTEIPFRTALREVVDQVAGARVELGFEAGDGLVKVATRELLDRNVYEEVYNITDLLMEIPDFDGPMPWTTSPSPAGYLQAASGAGRGTFENEGSERAEDVSEDKADEIIALIRKTVMPDSWRATGGDVGSISEISGQLVVTQTPAGHARVGGLLGKLRQQRAIQIAVEARFLTVQSNYLEELGVDLDIVLNTGNAGFDFLEDPDARGGFLTDPLLGNRLLLPRSFTRLGFTPSRPALGSTLADGPNAGLVQPFGLVGLVPERGSNFIGGKNTTPFPIVNNVLALTDPAAQSSDLPGSFAGGALPPAFSIFGSILDNIQVDFLIRATKAHKRTTIMTAPRLTLFNGQRARIGVINTQSFVSALVPVVNAAGSIPITQQALSGTLLDIEAVVSADKRYVTMNLRPWVGRLLGIQRFQFIGGGALAGDQFLQLPNVTATSIQTTVSVPDGGTLLVGGQKLSGEIEIEAGVPFLSEIPILKRFYTNKSVIKDEQVLLILIKPKIIIQREAEEQAFPTFGSR